MAGRCLVLQMPLMLVFVFLGVNTILQIGYLGTVNPMRVQVNGIDRYGTSASVVVNIDVKGQCFNMPPTPSASLSLIFCQ